MENTENLSDQPQDQQTKGKRLNLIMMVLLLLLAGLGVYLGVQNRNLKQQLEACGAESGEFEAERDQVVSDLEAMRDQYSLLETSNDTLNEALIAEKAKVEKLLEEAKNNKWNIYKLKKEASTLRDIMKGYVRTIDSLNTLNVELRAANADVNRKLNEEASKNEELAETNDQLLDKVKLGARIKSLSINAIGQRVRNNGIHKETDRANRVEKIRTCVTLMKNEVAEAGEKDVYLRIITPSGKVLAESSDASNMFEFEGTKGLYSAVKTIQYENKQLDVCLYWDVANELPDGEYTAEVYIEGYKSGTSNFTLR